MAVPLESHSHVITNYQLTLTPPLTNGRPWSVESEETPLLSGSGLASGGTVPAVVLVQMDFPEFALPFGIADGRDKLKLICELSYCTSGIGRTSKGTKHGNTATKFTLPAWCPLRSFSCIAFFQAGFRKSLSHVCLLCDCSHAASWHGHAVRQAHCLPSSYRRLSRVVPVVVSCSGQLGCPLNHHLNVTLGTGFGDDSSLGRFCYHFLARVVDVVSCRTLAYAKVKSTSLRKRERCLLFGSY